MGNGGGSNGDGSRNGDGGGEPEGGGNVIINRFGGKGGGSWQRVYIGQIKQHLHTNIFVVRI